MLGGLVARRLAWKLTWRGWVVVVLLLLGLLELFFVASYPFLAPTRRFPTRLLVVEGWMPHYAMKQVADEFLAHDYKRVVLVCPIINLDDKYISGKDEGENLAALLEKYRVPASSISVLYPIVAKKDRTYHSALAVKEWLAGQKWNQDAFNVITMGPHARRSRLLYRRAFEGRVRIGIIAAEDMQYNKRRWWRASEGVRDMLGESIAYLYARFVFHAS